MPLIYFNNPLHLPWQTNLYDAFILTTFLWALVYAVIRLRRGERIYAFVFVSAFVYGMTLELAGMATLNLYLQGNFAVMLNFPAIALFAGTTAMPLYVSLYYPVILSMGFKVIENLGMASRWQAAITGGLFMIFLDAPYAIEGALRHVVWWTYRGNFPMFQTWLGWPLVEMAWQGAWGAVFFYLMLAARQHLDKSSAQPWSDKRAFGIEAPLRAIGVLPIGFVLLLPLTIWNFAVGPQWPFMIVVVGALIVLVIRALLTASPRLSSPEPVLLGWVGWFVLAFGAMAIGNVVYERGVTLYVVVQCAGLIGVLALAFAPVYLGRRRVLGAATPDASATSASAEAHLTGNHVRPASRTAR